MEVQIYVNHKTDTVCIPQKGHTLSSQNTIILWSQARNEISIPIILGQKATIFKRHD